MAGRVRLERRLSAVRAEVAALREELDVLGEQVAHVEGVAAEAQTQALVEGTPLAERERRRAEQDVRRLRRERAELASRLVALAAESDELLERLFAGTEATAAGMEVRTRAEATPTGGE